MYTYTEEELSLIDQYKDLPKKPCKQCENVLPLHETFFQKEKRINDGFENRCRKCRGKGGKEGGFLKRVEDRRTPKTNKELLNKYKTVSELYDHLMKENEFPYPSFVLDNHLEIFKYIVSKEDIPIEEFNKLNRQWFQDRKLYSSLLRIYNGSVIQFVNAAYPNMLHPWEFDKIPRNFWNNEQNRLKALKWFVDKLLNDETISNIKEIPRKINIISFNEYGLSGLIEYYDHIHCAFDELYPNMFYIWQYISLPDGYLDNKENRIRCLRELIEGYLKLKIEDIPKVLSYEYFNRNHEEYGYRFNGILNNYYSLNVYEYVNEAYPNTFEKTDFPYKNHYRTLDNIIVRSEPERMLHHLFLECNLNYKYGDYVGRMKINGVTVLPDWYIYNNDKIVLVEYYGMLDMNDVDFGYNDKYIQKEKLYKQLCKDNIDYMYLDLYKEDMKNDFEGIKNKLKNYGII